MRSTVITRLAPYRDLLLARPRARTFQNRGEIAVTDRIRQGRDRAPGARCNEVVCGFNPSGGSRADPPPGKTMRSLSLRISPPRPNICRPSRICFPEIQRCASSALKVRRWWVYPADLTSGIEPLRPAPATKNVFRHTVAASLDRDRWATQYSVDSGFPGRPRIVVQFGTCHRRRQMIVLIVCPRWHCAWPELPCLIIDDKG